METKHTKGQWSVTNIFGGRDAKDSEGSIVIASDIEDRTWIAEAKGSHVNSGMELEEFQANAKLIAAAPDLLKTLTLVKSWIERGKSFESEMKVIIDLAIAKATEEF